MKYLIYHNFGPEPMLSSHHERPGAENGVSLRHASNFIGSRQRDDANGHKGYWIAAVRPAAPTYSVIASEPPSTPGYRDTSVVACMPDGYRPGWAAGLSWAEAVQVFHAKLAIQAHYGNDLHYEVSQDA